MDDSKNKNASFFLKKVKSDSPFTLIDQVRLPRGLRRGESCVSTCRIHRSPLILLRFRCRNFPHPHVQTGCAPLTD